MTYAADARLTDAERKTREETEAKKAADAALLRKDFNETFASAHGQRVLKYIMDVCGYQRSSTTVDPTTTKIITDNMLYNEARRNLYLSIRSFLKAEILIQVENKGVGNDNADIFS